MITLNSNSITNVTSTFQGVTTTVVTDILLVSYVELSFEGGSVMAIIKRGSIVNGVFTPNQPQLRVTVQADGSFASTDGQWSGVIPNWSAAFGQLVASFDGLLLAAGLVQGSEYVGS